MTLIFWHLVFGICGFLFVNWIGMLGKELLSYRLVTLQSLEDKTEQSSDFLYRVLAPVVFLILLSVLLLKLGREDLLNGIWIVVPSQFFARLIFNSVLTERAKLIRWKQFALQALGASTLGLLAYKFLIVTREPLLPDPKTIGNELWLLIGIFLYKVVSGIPVKDDADERRKGFIFERFKIFRSKYQGGISKIVQQENQEILVYAIMVVETFNRPRYARLLESLTAFVWPVTQGVMQVYSEKRISDRESVEIGSKKIVALYDEIATKGRNTLQKYKLNKGADDYWYKYYDRNFSGYVIERTAWQYNHSDDYAKFVREVFEILEKQFYKPKEVSPVKDQMNPFSNVLSVDEEFIE